MKKETKRIMVIQNMAYVKLPKHDDKNVVEFKAPTKKELQIAMLKEIKKEWIRWQSGDNDTTDSIWALYDLLGDYINNYSKSNFEDFKSNFEDGTIGDYIIDFITNEIETNKEWKEIFND